MLQHEVGWLAVLLNQPQPETLSLNFHLSLFCSLPLLFSPSLCLYLLQTPIFTVDSFCLTQVKRLMSCHVGSLFSLCCEEN